MAQGPKANRARSLASSSPDPCLFPGSTPDTGSPVARQTFPPPPPDRDLISGQLIACFSWESVMCISVKQACSLLHVERRINRNVWEGQSLFEGGSSDSSAEFSKLSPLPLTSGKQSPGCISRLRPPNGGNGSTSFPHSDVWPLSGIPGQTVGSQSSSVQHPVLQKTASVCLIRSSVLLGAPGDCPMSSLRTIIASRDVRDRNCGTSGLHLATLTHTIRRPHTGVPGNVRVLSLTVTMCGRSPAYSAAGETLSSSCGSFTRLRSAEMLPWVL
ncbi:hypothetical protein MG293_019308 [Ovis ammon polii]|uniref:Uncharacterized protein n=1 Tax=Ovis ammon polii TaxID=230172 RepID=A0AAD4TQG7_OVIAM|nr:hypothetical protein MG293_019308 [Ovis ammon polii]KAI4550727.1 hypothetical protein MJT46_018234 [Ovis ammon polii x Ovis aries]